jgi:hypothetical integral membrane protein (TIGR02206 family)
MDKYFSGKITGFEMFSFSHIITLLVLVIINVFLIIWFKKAKTAKALSNFRYLFTLLIILNEVLSIVWYIWAGLWSPDYSLPLQLCDIVTFLTIIMLIRNNYFSFEVVYFLGLGGSLQALLTPDLVFPYPHFMFFNFFICHGAIITAIIYMMVIKKFKPTLKSILKTFIFTNLYMVFAAAVNFITGGNYMFIAHKPETASLMDFLGPWPWYILSLEAVGLVIFFICYLPFIIKNFITSKSSRTFHSGSKSSGFGA